MLSWSREPALTPDPRFVGVWKAPAGGTTFDLRADGTFSYLPATGADEPTDGRWGVSVVKNPKNDAIPREPVMLHLRSETGWSVCVEVMKIGRDELNTPLPRSIAAMTRGNFPRFDPISYRRAR